MVYEQEEFQQDQQVQNHEVTAPEMFPLDHQQYALGRYTLPLASGRGIGNNHNVIDERHVVVTTLSYIGMP
jgi:hypothetical protein